MAALLAPDPSDLWKHRRRMAYVSLACLVATMLRAFQSVDEAQADVLGNLAYAFAGVIAAYTGFAVMDQSSKRTHERTVRGGKVDADALAPAREGD